MISILNKDFASSSLFILRIWLGCMMMYHSYWAFTEGIDGFAGYLGDKLGFPAPVLFAYLAKGSEFFGGLLLVLGLLVRLSAALIALTMAVAVFIAHGDHIIGEGELALNYLTLAIVIFWDNPLRFSLSMLMKKG